MEGGKPQWNSECEYSACERLLPFSFLRKSWKSLTETLVPAYFVSLIWFKFRMFHIGLYPPLWMWNFALDFPFVEKSLYQEEDTQEQRQTSLFSPAGGCGSDEPSGPLDEGFSDFSVDLQSSIRHPEEFPKREADSQQTLNLCLWGYVRALL